MTWIQTRTGVAFDLEDPRPHMVRVADVAHGLAHLCRFTGQCRDFYSVAEHSVLVSRAVPSELAARALLHDGAEAYVGDVSRPLKRMLSRYDLIEDAVQVAVAGRFDLPVGFAKHPLIKEADARMLATERAQLLGSCPRSWDLPVEPLPGVRVECWSPERAAVEFLSRMIELGVE